MTSRTPYVNQKEWDKHATHPLQSFAWGEFRKEMGIDVVRTEFGQLTFHRIPHTSWTIGYFPKGPLPTKTMLETLHNIGREHHAIFIQLEPNATAEISDKLQREIRLRLSHHPLFTRYTFRLNLTKSEEDLFLAMHHKTRYNIRLAKKRGVQVVENNSSNAFAAYLRLNKETTGRQKFYAHNETYHTTMWRIMHKAGIARLFTATYKNQILAAWIIFCWKDIIYYPYGTSSRNHREVMAPVLLLWEIARWGKSQGYKAFDLWGALGPDPDPKDPWYGFHRFKKGFCPDLIKYVGSYDFVISPALYRAYCAANTIRWFVLKTIAATRKI